MEFMGSTMIEFSLEFNIDERLAQYGSIRMSTYWSHVNRTLPLLHWGIIIDPANV